MSFVIRLKWFFKLRWSQYALAIVLMAMVSLLSTIPPKMIGNTIDHIRLNDLTAANLRSTVLILIGLSILLYVTTYVWITMVIQT